MNIILLMENKNGLYQEYYESWQKQYECNYIDGKINGSFQQYYQSGQLWIECNYINDKKMDYIKHIMIMVNYIAMKSY